MNLSSPLTVPYNRSPSIIILLRNFPTEIHRKGTHGENRDFKIHRLRVPVPVAVNTGRSPLTREKRVGYRVEWLRHYHIWEIMVAFLKLRGKYVRLPVPAGRNGVS